MATKLGHYLAEPTSMVPLVGFRITFGLMLLVSILRFWAKGWIHEFYIAPQFHFTYYGFEWVKPLPASGMLVVFGLILVAALFITLGLFYRWAMGLFFLLFTYVELLDKAYYLNHYYLISLLSFMLIFFPLNCAFSLDQRWHLTIGRATVPRAYLVALQVQLALVYVFAGIAKLEPDWLVHGLPMAIWLPAHSDFPVLGKIVFDKDWFAITLSWLGALYDLTIPFWLWWKRSRYIAYLAVIGFHGMTAALFPIGMFPWIMMVATLVFFSAEDWQGALGKIKIDTHRLLPKGEGNHRMTMHPMIAGILTLLLLTQMVIPLRHMLYRGDVLWTEEGYRFSWRVMLVEKSGYTTFTLTDSQTKQRWLVNPRQYLTPQQAFQMAFQPDMILSFAHYLRATYQAQGHNEVEVRVEAYVSWNGRFRRLLIDPTVDLAQEPNGLHHKTWIRLYDTD